MYDARTRGMSGNEDVHVARARIKYRLSTWTRDCHVHNINMGPGRREQKERERKRAAAMSQSLQKFLPPKKKTQ